jgi:hypothetical protein
MTRRAVRAGALAARAQELGERFRALGSVAAAYGQELGQEDEQHGHARSADRLTRAKMKLDKSARREDVLCIAAAADRLANHGALIQRARRVAIDTQIDTNVEHGASHRNDLVERGGVRCPQYRVERRQRVVASGLNKRHAQFVVGNCALTRALRSTRFHILALKLFTGGQRHAVEVRRHCADETIFWLDVQAHIAARRAHVLTERCNQRRLKCSIACH